MAYQSDSWYSRGEVAYDADDRPLFPACPVCGSTRTVALRDRHSQIKARVCTDQARHLAALATPAGAETARQHGMEF